MTVLLEKFQPSAHNGLLIGYRVMRYDIETGMAISGADSRHGVKLHTGGIMNYGDGHFITDNIQYAKDYYAVHDVNVVIKVEFNPDDVISGSLGDNQPEVFIKKSRIIDWDIFRDLDLEESNMTKTEETYSKLMGEVDKLKRAEELGLELQGKQDLGDGSFAPIFVNPDNGKSFMVLPDDDIDDTARRFGVCIPESNFDKTYSSIIEDMTAGAGGAFGDLGGQEHGGDLNSSDWYASGDARIPKALGAKEQKKRKGKKKKKGSKADDSIFSGKINFDITRRNFPSM